MMSTPKIHAEFIKAWADGYEIEAFNPERGSWITVPEPGWFDNIEYRVRPGAIEEPAKPFWAEYHVNVTIDPFDDDFLDIDNTAEPEDCNLCLVFRDEKLIEARAVNPSGETPPW